MNKSLSVLITDDDKAHREMLETVLGTWGYDTISAKDGVEALKVSEKGQPDIVLLDARMPRLDGFAALTQLHDLYPRLPIIMMTAYSDISAAVEAIRKGAWDYLAKPLDFEKLRITLRNAVERSGLLLANEELNDKLAASQSPLLGSSQPMLRLAGLISAVAPSEATCLITGESGTGKELAARAIHQASKRAKGPFVAINCGALTETLLASELFGHEKGAFTGADKARQGLFVQADTGTLFLDEIGEMPAPMQVRLLRALQEREILPVGAVRPIAFDCRIIAATNRDLVKEVESGNFREDLFYRLNVMNISMPPLRERGGDITALANHFAKRFAKANGREFAGITPEAARCLSAWKWPGNVRELENVMERAIILMAGNTIGERELPDAMIAQPAADAAGAIPEDPRTDILADGRVPTLEEVERKVILETLRRMGNNKTETARALGITRKTLHAKLNRYNNS